MNIKKLFFYIFMAIIVTLVSCSSHNVPVLRVADFNMPNTYFEILDQYDTKEYPKPVETTIVGPEVSEPAKPKFQPPAGEVSITFGGTLTNEFTNYEYNIIKGGAYIDIIATGTEWERDVGSDPELTRILIDSFEGSAQWKRQILSRLNTENITRLSGNIVRIRIPVPDYFNINTTEQVSLKLPAILLKGVKQGPIICRDRLYIKNGNGTEEDPFTISEARDFEALKVYPNKVFILEKDFDMEGYEWEPFEFSGTLYGNGKTIKNMKIEGKDGSPVGIFSVLTGKVTNLNLVDMIVEGQNDTGSIAGINKGVIQHCFITGTVAGHDNVGGIAGVNFRGHISKTNAMCSVKGHANIGGIAGMVSSGTIQGCCSNTLVTGFDSTGGIAGKVRYPGRISSCMATGGYIYGSGPSLSTAGRICGNPENDTLFNNAGTAEFQIMVEGTHRSAVSFGSSYNNNALTHRHGENLNCYTHQQLDMESYCDTGKKTYPYTNELFYYDLIYYGLNILVVLDNGIWMEDEIKSVEGIEMVTECLKESFKQSKAYATDLSINPENIYVYKNVLIIHTDPIKKFRASDNFTLEIHLPVSVVTTWSKQEHIATQKGIPYLNVMGTEESPYPIRTEKELWHFNEDPYSHYILANDIILHETDTWYWPDKITGSLNFNGKKIIRVQDMFKNPYDETIHKIP